MMPPSMPPVAAPTTAAAPAGGAAGMAAVMAAISAAGDSGITSGLKHVTKDMKTKNLADAPVVVPKAPVAATPKPVVAAAGPKAEPKMYEKQGKWFVEHYTEGSVTIPADELNVKQNVYIYKCSNTLITVPGKCKAICLDSCFKSNMICTSVVSTIEIVSCKNVGIQVDESAPAIAIDKSASVQVYLSKSAVEVRPDIVTSNITAVNVVVPGRQQDDDPIEIPIHEQYMTRFTDSFSLKTTPNDSI
jgi:adenylyl cyclase-associated protein